MSETGKIVAAVDFSSPSAGALREADRIAGLEKAHLTIVHVIDSRVLEALEDRITVEEGEIIGETEKRVRALIDQTIGVGQRGFELDIVIGHPFDRILKAVNTRKGDLLVLGSRGSQDGDPSRVGVIASKCVRKAPVPVLLVREDREDAPFRKILVCVDFSENSRKACEQAVRLAGKEGAEVEFLTIYQPLEGMFPIGDHTIGTVPVVSDKEMIGRVKEKLDAFVAPIVADAPGLAHAETVVPCSSVPRGITDHVNECGADLLALGTRGRTGLKVPLLGTTAEKAIHDCPCSTLAVKPDGFRYEHA